MSVSRRMLPCLTLFSFARCATAAAAPRRPFVQAYVNSLEFIQQWIVRMRAEPVETLQEMFEVQQKLYGNLAWCMYHRETYDQAARFCTRALDMFDDTPQGKIPDDVGVRAK